MESVQTYRLHVRYELPVGKRIKREELTNKDVLGFVTPYALHLQMPASNFSSDGKVVDAHWIRLTEREVLLTQHLTEGVATTLGELKISAVYEYEGKKKLRRVRARGVVAV